MVLTLYGLYSNVCSAICSVLLLRHGDDIYKMLPRTLVLAREVDSQWFEGDGGRKYGAYRKRSMICAVR
jgi:hypothetical protein